MDLRIWDMTADCKLIYIFAKNQVYAVFHSHAIRRSVSTQFIELCMETPCLCPSEGHKHAGSDVTKTLNFAIEMKIFTLEL